MIPVSLQDDGAGNLRWQGSFAVDETEGFRMLLLSGGAAWKVRLTEPGSTRSFDLDELQPEIVASSVGEYSGDLVSFGTAMKAGRWQISVAAAAGEAANGFLVVGSDSPYLLESTLTTRQLRVGETLSFTTRSARALENLTARLAAGKSADLAILDAATLEVTTPSGRVLDLALTDDGNGLLRASFVADEAGDYTARLTAHGTTPEGLPFLRSTQHSFPVLTGSLRLTSAALVPEASGRWGLRLGLDPDSITPEKVYAYGQLWGHGADGEAKAVAWLGGIAYVEDGALSLGLDTRWIQKAQAQGPYELRQIRLQDVDTLVPWLEQASLEVASPRLEILTNSLYQGEVDAAMRVGPRPAALDRLVGQAGTGSRLLLVHGYCSGDVWGPVAGQFSSASRFQDLNANRSHDTFAQLIWSFGNSWNSYGIVAHSQGGAASLHLYTYYWSGLDNATGSRLIQSVGTPYQGTALAGNLAVLGQIFGAGCGTNYDLTYSGASAWLANIPTWARQKVYFHTTSFTDRWWAYDYCSLATDLFLSDPEDGVVEKWSGQLSSGNNLGHKTGWCHTDGMRDPGQVRDSSRNANMNANAAR
jgi:hypothetical protein